MDIEKKKLILENKSDLSMSEFLKLAIDIVEDGRISNDGKQYCYITTFTLKNGSKYMIASDLNDKSDKLTLYND